MTDYQRSLIAGLVEEGYKRLNAPKGVLHFGTASPESEALLNDIEKHPHFYVIGCVMDRQIKAEKAWVIPYLVGKYIGSFKFSNYLNLTENDLIKLFEEKKYHRFNKTMGICFYRTLQDIHTVYQDDASRMWKGNPRSIDVVKRFDDLEGVGDKIANMAVNILIRDYKIPMSDYSTIDIPPDSQVKKFFIEYGFIEDTASPKDIRKLARALYPKYPAIFDIAWEEGRKIKK